MRLRVNSVGTHDASPSRDGSDARPVRVDSLREVRTHRFEALEIMKPTETPSVKPQASDAECRRLGNTCDRGLSSSPASAFSRFWDSSRFANRRPLNIGFQTIRFTGFPLRPIKDFGLGSTLRVWWTACTLLLLCLLPGLVGATPCQAIVKIYTVATRPDYDNPWNRMGPHTSTGSGAILVGQCILTNAHVVSNHTYLQVRRHGSARKYQAHVIAMANDADLALLGIEDPTFFEGVTPLELGTLPRLQNEVTVLGFPTGGDTLSSTAGVVSRIEHRRYVHSGMSLLAAQLDAAINSGNSGGPVIAGNS